MNLECQGMCSCLQQILDVHIHYNISGSLRSVNFGCHPHSVSLHAQSLQLDTFPIISKAGLLPQVSIEEPTHFMQHLYKDAR